MANDGSVVIEIIAEDSDIKKTLNGVENEAESAADGLDKVGDSAENAGKEFGSADVAIGTFVGNALTNLSNKLIETVGNIAALADETREYREDMAKLDAAFKSAGHSTETAQKAYNGFYKLLGESDRSVEAVNHLAELTDNTEEVAKWTDIAAGVTAKFGDSLPIEGLTEAANETAKVGAVTGPLADALNWAGISEDAFNEKLKACNSEQERATLITNTLSTEYQAAAAEYNALTANTQAARDATNRMEQAQAALGAVMEPVTTAWTNIKAGALEWVAQSLTTKESTDVLTESQRANVTASHEQAEAYRATKAAAQELAAAQLADVDFATNTLLPQLQALVDANGNVKQGYEERAKFILGQLNEAYGTEYTKISEIVGKNGELKQSISDVIEAKKAQILLAAHEEDYKVAVENITEAERIYFNQMREIAALTDSVKNKEAELEELRIQHAKAVANRQIDEANVISDKMRSIQYSITEEQAGLAVLKKSYDDSKVNYEKFTADIAAYDTAKTLILEGNTAEALTYLNILNDGYESTGSAAEDAANRELNATEERLKNAAMKLTLLQEEYAASEEAMTEAQKVEMQNRIEAAKKEVENLGKEAETLGSNLVEGIGVGADGKKDWLSGKLGGIVTAAIEAAKKAGIIHSPSRKMRDEVGKMLAAGLAIGLEQGTGPVVKAGEKLMGALQNRIDKEQKASIKTIADYNAEITSLEEDKNKRLKELEEKFIADKKKKNADKAELEKQYNKNIESINEQHAEKVASIQENIKKTITDKMQEIVTLGDTYKDNVKQIWEDLEKSITDLQANYDNQLASRTAAIAQSLNLWAEVSRERINNGDLVHNLKTQVRALEDFNEAILNLESRGISEAFINQLKSMGVAAVDEIEALTKMSDTRLNNYVALWEKKNELAKNAALEELEPLKAETEAKIEELTTAALDKYATLRAEYMEQGALLMAELKQAMIDAGQGGYEEIIAQIDEYTSAGEDLMSGVVAGIANKSPEVADAVTRAVNRAIAAAKAAAGIASPSKVMKKEVGANLAEGVNVGWSDKIAVVKNKMSADMQSIVARMKMAVSLENERMAQGVGVRDTGFTEVARAVGLQTAGINSLASEYRNGSSKQVTIPLILDGRTLGEAFVDLADAETTRRGVNLVLK